MPTTHKNQTIPVTTDPPDGPANFERLVDSVVDGRWATNGASGNVMDLLANGWSHPFDIPVAYATPAGSLVMVQVNMDLHHLSGTGTCNFRIRDSNHQNNLGTTPLRTDGLREHVNLTMSAFWRAPYQVGTFQVMCQASGASWQLRGLGWSLAVIV